MPRRDYDEDDYDDEDDRPRRRRRPPPDLGDDPAMRMLLPVGQAPLAIVAGYVGLFAVLCFPAPVALVLGVLALRQIGRNPKLHGKGRAWFAVVMGGFFTLLPLALFVYAALKKD